MEKTTLFSIFFGAISFLLGAYVGHRFNIWQDKRKEFNVLVDELRPRIRREIEDPCPSDPVGITDDKLDVLSSYFWGYRKFDMRMAVARYNQACDQQGQYVDDFGQVFYPNPGVVQKAAADLFIYFKRR